MNKKVLKVVAVFVLAMVWSCGPKITGTKTSDNDLSKYDSYAYLPNSNFDVQDNVEKVSDDVGKWILEAVNNNMQRAGYTMDKDNPDLLVILNSNYDKKSEVYVNRDYANYPYATTYGVSSYYQPYYYSGYSNYNYIADYDVNVSRYTEAALTVDVVDRETKNIVWSGSAKDYEIYQQDVSREVAESVDNIFSKYPTITQN